MNDERLREASQRGLPTGDDRAPLDDLGAERIRKLVEREGSDEERLHTLDTLLSSRGGRAELDIVLAAARAARPVRRVPRWVGLAAVALLAVGIPTAIWLGRPAPEPVRGGDSPIRLVTPVGAEPTGRPAEFVWRSLAGAERYTLIVVDTAGRDVFVSETTDTAVQVPDSVTLAPGETYLWWVQARTRTGEVVTGLTERIAIGSR